MPTTFPKCNPTEMMGLLVLLNNHKGSEDVALLADDLDLEIDEIFPALEFAEVLQLLKVTEGRATFTDLGKKLVGGSIRDRKSSAFYDLTDRVYSLITEGGTLLAARERPAQGIPPAG